MTCCLAMRSRVAGQLSARRICCCRVEIRTNSAVPSRPTSTLRRGCSLSPARTWTIARGRTGGCRRKHSRACSTPNAAPFRFHRFWSATSTRSPRSRRSARCSDAASTPSGWSARETAPAGLTAIRSPWDVAHAPAGWTTSRLIPGMGRASAARSAVGSSWIGPSGGNWASDHFGVFAVLRD